MELHPGQAEDASMGASTIIPTGINIWCLFQCEPDGKFDQWKRF